MSIVLSFKQISLATRLLLLGWGLLLLSLFMPFILIDLPNTDYARLLFLGPESSASAGEGSVDFPTHISIDGWKIALITFTKAIGKASMYLGWSIFFLLNIPALLAFIAPVLLWFKSRLINILLAIYYGMSSFILIILMMFFMSQDILIGLGFYLSIFATLLLMSSRIMVCRKSE